MVPQPKLDAAGEEAPEAKSEGGSERRMQTPPHTCLRPLGGLGEHLFSGKGRQLSHALCRDPCIGISLPFGGGGDGESWERGCSGLNFHICKMGLAPAYHQTSLGRRGRSLNAPSTLPKKSAPVGLC